MCRRAGIRRFGALRDAAARLYPPDRVPAFVDDVEHARLALLDLASVLFTLSGPCMFSSPETRRTQYVDAMRTLVDFSCRFHVIAFRDPQFLDSVFDAESGLPYTDPDPCMRRFIRSLDSFRQRVGGLPAFDRTRASSEWLAHLGPDGHIDQFPLFHPASHGAREGSREAHEIVDELGDGQGLEEFPAV